MERLVSTEWLAGELGKRDLVVLDATKFLPGQAGDGRMLFREGHIPGARYFDVDEIADTDAGLPHMAPSPSRFAHLVGMLGISNASRIVFYDHDSTMWATRGWWMMGLFGHDAASVLDGGLTKWRAEDLLVESGEPPPIPPTRFVPNFRAGRLRGIGDILEIVDHAGELILDARAAERYAGAVPEARPGLRAGHIPGARSLPYSTLLNPDKTFRSPEELRALLTAAGVDGSRPVVTSCGSGVSATVLTMGMALAGMPHGAVYDGSWTEWGGRPDTRVATGPEPHGS